MFVRLQLRDTFSPAATHNIDAYKNPCYFSCTPFRVYFTLRVPREAA